MARRLENDRWLFYTTLILCLFGAVMVFSASAVTAEQHYGRSYIFLLRQAAWLVIGLFGMFAMMRLDYRRLREPAVIYTTVCAVLVMLIGAFFLSKSHATHRWIKFGPLNLQPSELAKLGVILYLAWFLDLKRRSAAKMEFCKDDFIHTILPAAGPILVCIGVILLQPDLGTAVDIAVIAIAVLFVAGLSWKWIASGVLVALPLLYLLIMRVPYREARMMAFLNPESDPQGAGFQLLQSLIAVGSGGFWGKGFRNGTQNQLGYIPVRYSDFIMSAWAEEQGFKGVLIALGLYMALLLRLVQNAQRAKDRAGMFLVMGVAAALGFHVLVNVAMVIGAMPVTGIPLPLMSYGGSATLFVFLAIGLVMNVRIRRFVN